MNELLSASATTLAQRIRERDISAEEVVTAYLDRIDAVNPLLNAVVQMTVEAAVEQARAADSALARGEHPGPLHGVPFTVKDVFDVAGVISAAGIEERAAFVPTMDAVTVARVRAAGGILLGKTNCPPGGGGGETDNPVYGRTNNPYNLSRTPGGSSGGEAATIAAGGSPMGLGSDSGGSIRVPAHYCGIAGLKPTSGRVPNTGVLNHPGGLSDPRTQIGPMARFVEDLWPLFVTVAGVDWRDSGVVPMPVGDPEAIDVPSLRIAYYDEDGSAPATEETRKAVQNAVSALRDTGATVEAERPSQIGEAVSITQRYWELTTLPGAEIEQLYTDWDRFRTAFLTFMETRDVIVCPAADTPALPHGTEGDNRFSYTLPYSLVGWPCVVVRAGTSPEQLPIGVQIVARPWREDVAVAVALQIESALGGWQPPSLPLL